MVPEDILNPLRKRHTLPTPLIKFLYLLLKNEIANNFTGVCYLKDYDRVAPEKRIAQGLDHILSRLPPLSEQGFTSTIRELAKPDEDYLCSLITNQFKYHYQNEVRDANREIRDLEWKIACAETDDKPILRYRLSEAKRNKDNIPEPLDKPSLTKFWLNVLYFPVCFSLPERLRFQHMHVMGATGTGKTQLLQQLIYQDLQTDAALIVMTLKGSMLPTLQKHVPPERLIYLSPDNPIPLNIFHGTHSDASIELIHHIFSGLLDADPTGKQTSLLDLCIKLLTFVPGAHLKTLYELIESEKLPTKYQPYVNMLPEFDQEFFAKRFKDKEYQLTKQQILWRLDLVLKNTFVQKILCRPESGLDMREVMDEGKVLLVDTSEDVFGTHGSAFLGRFILALVTLAAKQRKGKRPVFFYIDEAGSYLSPNIAAILERAREARVGLTIAHQQLDHLKNLEPTVMTNTAIKIIGRASEADAKKFSTVMDTDFKTFVHLPDLQFFIKAQGFLPHAIPIQIKYGFLENLPRQYEHTNRTNLAAPYKPPQVEKSTDDTGTEPSPEW